jgi:hypothetical protein
MLTVDHVVLPQLIASMQIADAGWGEEGQLAPHGGESPLARLGHYSMLLQDDASTSPSLGTAIHKHGLQCGITHLSLLCYIVWGCRLRDRRRGLKRRRSTFH